MIPRHFPEASPDGPWGVESSASMWHVCDVRTGRSKRIGPVGSRRVNWFDRAMEEAARRNTLPFERCTKCGKPSVRGLIPGAGKCRAHWAEGVWGKVLNSCEEA